MFDFMVEYISFFESLINAISICLICDLTLGILKMLVCSKIVNNFIGAILTFYLGVGFFFFY